MSLTDGSIKTTQENLRKTIPLPNLLEAAEKHTYIESSSLILVSGAQITSSRSANTKISNNPELTLAINAKTMKVLRVVRRELPLAKRLLPLWALKCVVLPSMGAFEILNILTGKVICRIKEESILDAIYSEDLKLLMTCGNTYGIKFWNLSTGENVDVLNPKKKFTSIQLQPESNVLIAKSFDKEFLWIYDISRKRLLQKISYQKTPRFSRIADKLSLDILTNCFMIGRHLTKNSAGSDDSSCLPYEAKESFMMDNKNFRFDNVARVEMDEQKDMAVMVLNDRVILGLKISSSEVLFRYELESGLQVLKICIKGQFILAFKHEKPALIKLSLCTGR